MNSGRQTVAAINAAGGQSEYVHLDVTREESWIAAVNLATSRFGKLDILVNNAGVFIGKGIEEISLAEWEKLVAVNMTGRVPRHQTGGSRRCGKRRSQVSMAAPSSISPRLPASSARSSIRCIR